MRTGRKSWMFCAATIFGTFMFCALTCPAQTKQANAPPAAPVPDQITSARKIFISNGGENCSDPDRLAGTPNITFNQFYAGMKTWGRYQIVSRPADADLVFEITFECPLSLGPASQANAYDSRVRLHILDPKTDVILWTITEHAEEAYLKKTKETNLVSAVSAVVTALKTLTSPGAATTN